MPTFSDYVFVGAFFAFMLAIVALVFWQPIRRFYYLSKGTPSPLRDTSRRDLIVSVGKSFRNFWFSLALGCSLACFAVGWFMNGINQATTGTFIVGIVLGVIGFFVSIIVMTPLMWVTALSEEVEHLHARLHSLEGTKVMPTRTAVSE